MVVTKENKKMVVKQLRAWNKSINQGISRERLEKLLFVSPVPINLPKPAKVCNVHPTQGVMQILKGVGRDSFLAKHFPAIDVGGQL